MAIVQLTDHYGHWFSELFFSRNSESTTGYAYTLCVGSFTPPGIYTRWKGPPTFILVSLPKDIGERSCLCFETAAGGIEPPSSRVTVRRSTARPLLPTNWCRHLAYYTTNDVTYCFNCLLMCVFPSYRRARVCIHPMML